MFQILWQNPAALFALAAVAAPILIHILVQRRAETFAFPTLRFLQPTRLAAIRRHVLEDAALLAVRIGILAAAVAALAGPLVVTPARRQAWERRIVRAVVTDAGGNPGRSPMAERAPLAYQSREFSASSLPDGIQRAVDWLETAPPARRELVVVSRFPIGSITAADIAAVPASIGVQLERAGTLPAARTVDLGRVVAGDRMLARELTLDGARTSVRETAATGRAAWPIEIVNTPAAQPAIDAAVAAVLAERVWPPAPDRRARLVIDTPVPNSGSGPELTPVQTPWMAEAVATLTRDLDLQSAAARVPVGLGDARFAAAPWLTVAVSSDGRPLAVAGESTGRLTIASAAAPTDLFTPLMLRSLADALGVLPNIDEAEVVPIADQRLREWSRPSAVPNRPVTGALHREDGDNDRQWLWAAALCLLAIETWMRRARAAAAEHREDAARVA